MGCSSWRECTDGTLDSHACEGRTLGSTVVFGVVVATHVEIVAGVLAGIIQASMLVVVGRSAFPCTRPCFSHRPCIVPSDLGVALGVEPFLILMIPKYSCYVY